MSKLIWYRVSSVGGQKHMELGENTDLNEYLTSSSVVERQMLLQPYGLPKGPQIE
jgi:hypothetical protein